MDLNPIVKAHKGVSGCAGFINTSHEEKKMIRKLTSGKIRFYLDNGIVITVLFQNNIAYVWKRGASSPTPMGADSFADYLHCCALGFIVLKESPA